MSRLAGITILYIAFAIVATGVNLTMQWLSLRVYQGPLTLPVAMVWGTGAGLVTKYLLDKNWIFRQHKYCAANHLRKFSGYALTGVATTAFFWACELSFNAIGPSWRLTGAALGLGLGYAAKYQLDRRFVFGSAP